MISSLVPDLSDQSPVSPDVFDNPADRVRDRYMNAVPEALSVDSDELTDIELRLDFLRVLDTRDIGRGDIAVVAVTADDLGKTPFELKLQTFQSVRAGQQIDFGDAGVTVYRNDPQGTIPRYIEYRILAVELDSEIRDAGKWLDELESDPNYKAVRDALIAAVGVAQPQIGVIAAGVDLLLQFVAGRLKANRDDQLIFVAGSYNTKIDRIRQGTRAAYYGTDYAQLAYSVRAG